MQLNSMNVLEGWNEVIVKIKNLTRKEAEQIIRLMAWAVEESNSELIKKDFERLSDRLMDLTRNDKE